MPALSSTATMLSSVNSVSAVNAAIIGPAATVTQAAPPYTRQRSGVMLVSAVLGGTGAAGAMLTVQMLKDGVPIGPAYPVSPGTLGAWWATLSQKDTLSDGSPHVYSIQGSGAPGLTVPVAGTQIVVVEE